MHYHFWVFHHLEGLLTCVGSSDLHGVRDLLCVFNLQVFRICIFAPKWHEVFILRHGSKIITLSKTLEVPPPPPCGHIHIWKHACFLATLMFPSCTHDTNHECHLQTNIPNHFIVSHFWICMLWYLQRMVYSNVRFPIHCLIVVISNSSFEMWTGKLYCKTSDFIKWYEDIYPIDFHNMIFVANRSCNATKYITFSANLVFLRICLHLFQPKYSNKVKKWLKSRFACS